MNRLLYILLVTAITIVGFIMYQQKDVGSIQIMFAGYSFESNLLVFGTALIIVNTVLLLFVLAIKLLINLVNYVPRQRQKRLQEKAKQSLSRGLIEYADGKFEKAEKTLLQPIKYSDNLLPVYLNAARAAQQLDAHERRDEYLNKAFIAMPEADVAIRLTKAELQLAHNQNEQALATLTQLYELKPQHTYVLTLLTNTYLHLQDWEKLNALLPQLKKYGNFSAESFLSFEMQSCKGMLSNLAKTSDEQALTEFWKNTAKHLKSTAEIVEHYVRQLVIVNATEEAENVLRVFLNKNWHDSSIIVYSELDVIVNKKQLEVVESWLNKHQQNEYLLLTLGKLCIAHALWGKARNYLEASLSVNPLPETYLKLARLLEENMNETEAAQKYYRQGLLLIADDYSEEVKFDNDINTVQETPQLKIVKS